VNSSVVVVDTRPYFAKALSYGLEHGLLSHAHLSKMEDDAPKGIVQIADHFGTAYLRTDLETAVQRLVNLISLYLEDQTDGDLGAAALSLRDNTLLSHSRGGSEMLKRLHAMPKDTGLHSRSADAAGQKLFVNERSFAFPLSVASYREQVRQCQANQAKIDFARWLARKMQAKAEDCEDYSAEEVVRSAMLVLLVGAKTPELPSKTQFVKLVEAVRKTSFKVVFATVDAFLKEAPEAFCQQTRQAVHEFIEETLPRLRTTDKSADEILHAEAQGTFFVREVPEEDVVAYDRLVAREWVRITKGEGDDPAVLASIFLNVATGNPPKASLLLKEAKHIVQVFRSRGFDTGAVLAFIDQYAPFEQREDLKALWQLDLLPDAEIQLADNDPQMPDTFMERALKYFKQNCVATWKGSNR